MSEKKVVGRKVAIALGIICIIFVVGLVGAIANYTSIINGNKTSFKEPTTLTTKINTTESLKNDLESLGCKIINSANWGTPNSLANYTEFRRMAYNTEVVFWYDTGIYGYLTAPPPVGQYISVDDVTLYIIFDGTILSIFIRFYIG